MGARIVFIINSLHTGGAERVLERLLRHGADRARGYDVHVVLLDNQPQMRSLPDYVHIHVLNGRGSLIRSACQLRRCLRALAPDLAVSLLVRANICTAWAMRGRRGRAILCERMHLGSHLAGRYAGVRLAVLRVLPRIFYRMADLILAVSEGVRQNLIHQFGVPAEITRTVNNPYDIAAIRREGAVEPEIALPPRFIVGVGRLVPPKNFAMLIQAYAASALDIPLVILGEGEERPMLEAQIAHLGLNDRIWLPGFLHNPYAVVARADFLVSSSRNEGFPNAIAEAMVLHCPVVATDCPSGPAELLDGTSGAAGCVAEASYGLIVGDGDLPGLIAGISMMTDPVRRARLSAAGALRMEDFRIERIAEEYWTLFDAFLPADERR